MLNWVEESNLLIIGVEIIFKSESKASSNNACSGRCEGGCCPPDHRITPPPVEVFLTEAEEERRRGETNCVLILEYTIGGSAVARGN
ncbi:unnamed protein product [Lactuca virosa]|uniref:Uncharacterized protein n=1 Tax=Lactuca virosa TaxID=75947 RepID=A0AAU9LR55_9ASTR|nr:unnamed protein product [Lactuca virosa]